MLLKANRTSLGCVTTQALCQACVEGVTFEREQVHMPGASRPERSDMNMSCYLWQLTGPCCSWDPHVRERGGVTGWVSVCSSCQRLGGLNNRNPFSTPWGWKPKVKMLAGLVPS